MESRSRERDGNGRILVMDDEEMIRTLVKNILEAEHYTVETVEDGDQAITRYRAALEQGTPFDCVIMDLTIHGGKGGAEAIKDILALDGNATVIVSSGYSVDPIMANYREYGFSGFLPKPFNMNSLREVIGRALMEKKPAF